MNKERLLVLRMHVWIVLVIFGYFFIPIDAYGPSFSLTKDVLEGLNVSIECNVTVTPDTEIYWTKGSSDVPYHIGLKLEFTEINRNESGNYSCHSVNITNPDQNRTIETVIIDVQYPAEIVQFSVDHVSLMENKTLTVTCDMEGNPNPVWQIRNNRTHDVLVTVRRASSTTAITDVRCGESGTYICTGSNELNHGTNVTRGQNVTVLCAPRTDPVIPGSDVTISVLGVPALLFANVIGYPYPSYNWSRTDGQPLGKVEEYTYPSFAVLNVTYVKWTDFGNYTVTMSNIYGSSKYVCELRPYGPPQVPMNFEYSNVTDNGVTLHWTSGYDMDGVMYFEVKSWSGNQWTKISPLFTHDYEDHGVGQNWTYVLSDLRADTSYTLAVAAKSKDFMSRESNSIQFRTTGVPDTPSHHGGLTDKEIAVISISLTVGLIVLAVASLRLFFWNRRRRSENLRLLLK